MASQPRPSEASRSGILVIDLGSTATRAVVELKQGDQETGRRKGPNRFPIQDTQSHDDNKAKRFDRGETPSIACPFDREEGLVGYDAANQTAKRTCSVKSMIYFLADDTDDHAFTRALHEHESSLSTPEEKKDFKGHLKNLLSRFLKNVIEKAITKGLEADFDLHHIALCIPNTWSSTESKAQKELSRILDNIVSGMNIETTFIFEAESRAQWLLWRQPFLLKDHDYLMVLDFGGHSLGGSHGVIRWGNDGIPFLYSPSKSHFGSRGGYEIWEIEIGNIIDQHMTKDGRAREIPRQASEHDPPTYRLNIDLSNKLGENEKHTFAIDISVEELNAAWDTAYRQILNLAKENIRLVCEKEDVKKVFILLSGGSIANPKAKNEMMDACNTRGRLRSHGTTRNKITVKMMEDLMAYGWKWTQAEGAAHAMATTMDVEEFFARGAALAVQKSTFRGKWRFHTSGHAKLLFYKEKHFAVEISRRDEKIFRLIADPDFIHDKDKPTGPGPVSVNNSYDICDLSSEYEPTPGALPLPIPAGKYNITVSDIKYDGQKAVLTLQLSPEKRGTLLRKAVALYFEVPLISQSENNLVMLNQDLIKDNFWKPRADPKPVGQAIPAKRSMRRTRSNPRVETDSEGEGEADGHGGGNNNYDGRPAKRAAMADTQM